MKKLLFIMAAVACLLSCRSVKNESTLTVRHYSKDADTLAAVSYEERHDSTNYYHGVIDSLAQELRNVRQMYRNIYVQDSINENRYRADSVNVKDSTWMQINADGSVSHYNYREKNTYSFLQLERYRQQIVKESKATIDSLVERNTYLQARYDSISKFRSLADSVSIYKAKVDSLMEDSRSKEKTIVEKLSLWSLIKVIGGTLFFCAIFFAAGFIYLRCFRRR